MAPLAFAVEETRLGHGGGYPAAGKGHIELLANPAAAAFDQSQCDRAAEVGAEIAGSDMSQHRYGRRIPGGFGDHLPAFRNDFRGVAGEEANQLLAVVTLGIAAQQRAAAEEIAL